MIQYIDKSALTAKIKRMLQEEYPCDNSEQTTGYHCALYELQDFLDTLEVKEVDLEKEIETHLKECLDVSDCPQTDCDNCKFEDFEDNITWCKDKIFKKDIEYTRTDAFIEKACEFIKERIVFEDNTWYIEGEITLKDKVIEDFKNYLKGE